MSVKKINTVWLDVHEALGAVRTLLAFGADFLPEHACGVIRHALNEESNPDFSQLKREIESDAMAEIIAEAKCKMPILKQQDSGFKLALLSVTGTGSVTLSVSIHGSYIVVQHDSELQPLYEWGLLLNPQRGWKVPGTTLGVPIYEAVFHPEKHDLNTRKIWAGGESHCAGSCV